MEVEPSCVEGGTAAAGGEQGEVIAEDAARRADGALSWGDAGLSEGVEDQVNSGSTLECSVMEGG